MHDRQHGVAWLRDQPYGGLGDDAQRALRAHQQADEVGRITLERVEVVAADPPEEFGEPPVDLLAIALHDRRHTAEQLPLPACPVPAGTLGWRTA